MNRDELHVVSEERLAAILKPYLTLPVGLPSHKQGGAQTLPTRDLYPKLLAYLQLLLRWNARTNLTSVRDPESVIRRHFGESLFAARALALLVHEEGAAVLDFGSGAGFPGLPTQLLLPSLQITLAESQIKKVAFLREVIRVLELPTEVWPERVSDMNPERKFDAVMMRAVDRSAKAHEDANARLMPGGWIVTLRRVSSRGDLAIKIPGSASGELYMERGTSAKWTAR